MALDSWFKKLGPVALPYRERQRYMHSFDLANPVMAAGKKREASRVSLEPRRARQAMGVKTADLAADAVDAYAIAFSKPLEKAAWEDGRRDGWSNAMEAEHPPEEEA